MFKLYWVLCLSAYGIHINGWLSTANKHSVQQWNEAKTSRIFSQLPTMLFFII